jgi:DNA-binding CsgD family transcriptional regulator
MSFPAGVAPRQPPHRQRETTVPFRIARVLTLIAALGLTAEESARGTRGVDGNGLSGIFGPCCCGSEHLTEREISVLCLIAAGHSNAEIAKSLHISGHTVDRHVTEMLRRSDVPNRAALVARAYSLGILRTADWPPRQSGRRCLRQLPQDRAGQTQRPAGQPKSR